VTSSSAPGRPVSAAASGRAVVVVFSAAFAVLVAIAAVQVATGHVDGSRGLLLACLGVWAVAYALLAVPAFADQSGWRPRAFLVVHVAVCCS
jgi:hypothetical protein